MLAETSKLYVEMAYRDNGFKSGMAGASRQTKTLGLDMTKLNSGLSKVKAGIGQGLKIGAAIGGAAIGFLAYNVKKGIDSLAELETVTAATNAVIKSTKGIAGLTTQAISDLAQKYEDLTTVDDKVIQKGENVLLTFTNIRKKAFEPALLAALNLSTAMGTDLQGSIVQIGKALNDPIKGITALSRVGVSFTEQQKKQIATLVEHNKLFEAQKIILDELNKEFGGQAKASADTYAGAQRRLGDAVEGLQQALAKALLPAITKVSLKLSEFLKDPAVVQKIEDLGQTIAGLFSDKNIEEGASGVKKLFGFLADLPWGVIKDGLKQSAEVAGRMADIFRGLPPDLQKGLIGLLAVNKLTGGLVASGIGDLVKFTLGSLKTIYAGNVTVVGANVGGGGIPRAGGTGGGKVGGLKRVGTSLLETGGLAAVGISIMDFVDNLDSMSSFLKGDVKGSFQQMTGAGKIFRDSTLDAVGSLMGIPNFAKVATDMYANAPATPAGAKDLEPIIKNTAANVVDAVNEVTSTAVRIAERVATDKAIADQTARIQSQGDRMTRLQMRLNGAVMLGDKALQVKIEKKINQEIAATHGTKNAVDHNTGVLRNKKSTFTVNTTFRPSVNISGTAVASVVSQILARNRFVAS